jgi:hypothetical protein
MAAFAKNEPHPISNSVLTSVNLMLILSTRHYASNTCIGGESIILCEFFVVRENVHTSAQHDVRIYFSCSLFVLWPVVLP